MTHYAQDDNDQSQAFTGDLLDWGLCDLIEDALGYFPFCT
jgi:hypothetical protein